MLLKAGVLSFAQKGIQQRYRNFGLQKPLQERAYDRTHDLMIRDNPRDNPFRTPSKLLKLGIILIKLPYDDKIYDKAPF
jgi:hypothetical protein